MASLWSPMVEDLPYCESNCKYLWYIMFAIFDNMYWYLCLVEHKKSELFIEFLFRYLMAYLCFRWHIINCIWHMSAKIPEKYLISMSEVIKLFQKTPQPYKLFWVLFNYAYVVRWKPVRHRSWKKYLTFNWARSVKTRLSRRIST